MSTQSPRTFAAVGVLAPVFRAIARHPMISFVLIAYAIQVGLTYGQYYRVEMLGVGFFRVYAPAIVALAVAAVAYGRTRAWGLLSSLVAWRAHVKYYLFAVAYPPVVAIVSVLLLTAVGLKHGLEFDLVTIGTVDFFQLSLTVSLVEEIAWIGFALVVMRSRLSLLSSALVVGTAWGVWYIPLVLTEMQVAPGLPIAPLILNFMTIAAICGWLYHRTGSAMLVAIMQITTNYTSQLVPVLPLRGGVTQYVLFVVIKSLFALSLYLIWGPKPLLARAGQDRPGRDASDASAAPDAPDTPDAPGDA